MATEIVALGDAKHADDLRNMWQGRCLREANGSPLGSVLTSMLDHAYGTEHLLVLLQCVFPGFEALNPPFPITLGTIRKNGNITADFAMEVAFTPLGQRYVSRKARNVRVFVNTADMQNQFRRLADKLRLSDNERRELFIAVKKWVVADNRLDPTMNPNDPDARRLVVH